MKASTDRRTLLSAFIEPNRRTVWSYLIGTIALGVGGSAGYELARRFAIWTGVGDGVPGLTIILAFSVGSLLFAGWLLQTGLNWWSGRGTPQIGISSEAAIQPRRALVVIVSARSDGPHGKAVKAHFDPEIDLRCLTHCWAVHTRDSEQYAEQLRDEYREQGVTVHPREVHDVSNLQDAYTVVRQCIDEALATRELPSPRKDQVIVDVTGGTAPMTAGAILACLEKQVSIQYIYTPLARRPDDTTFLDFANSSPRLLDIAWISGHVHEHPFEVVVQE